jgi:hypothetical protein
MEFDPQFFNECLDDYKRVFGYDLDSKEIPDIKNSPVTRSNSGSGIRKKSLIPIDPNTLEALVDYEPCEKIFGEAN